MRYFLIVIAVAVWHRILWVSSIMLALLFGLGGSPVIGDAFLYLGVVLDFPVVLVASLSSTDHFTSLVSSKNHLLARTLWSLAVGITVAIAYHRYRRNKHEDKPPQYWKSGL